MHSERYARLGLREHGIPLTVMRYRTPDGVWHETVVEEPNVRRAEQELNARIAVDPKCVVTSL